MENLFNWNFNFLQNTVKLNHLAHLMLKMNSVLFAEKSQKVIGNNSIKFDVNQIIKEEVSINTLNNEIEERVKERTSELIIANNKLKQEKQNALKAGKLLEEKNKDILASLNYAKLIQNAIIHRKETIEKLLPQSFMLNMPLDIVSGDFVRVEAKQNKILVALADCTGHGIPGAMMSMIGCALFNDIVNNKNVIAPIDVLRMLDSAFRELTHGETKINDGMDIGLCSIDMETLELNYAGAHRPLYILRNGALIEIKSDNLSIGGDSEDRKQFTNHFIQLYSNDRIYMFSDGFTDQFGGIAGKKFSSKRLKDLLLSIQHLNMEEQENYLKQTIIEWKGEYCQVDDICVLGIHL